MSKLHKIEDVIDDTWTIVTLLNKYCPEGQARILIEVLRRIEMEGTDTLIRDLLGIERFTAVTS